MIVRGVLESEWSSMQGSMDRLRCVCPYSGWGVRRPLVIRRAWSKLDIKVEVSNAQSAEYLVRGGLAWHSRRLGVGLATGGSGPDVSHMPGAVGRGWGGLAPATGGRGVPVDSRGGVHFFGDGAIGHVYSVCTVNGPKCFSCRVVGHVSQVCPRRSLPRLDSSGCQVAVSTMTGGGGASDASTQAAVRLKRPMARGQGGLCKLYCLAGRKNAPWGMYVHV